MSGYGTRTTDQIGRDFGCSVDPTNVRRKVGGITIDWSTVPAIGRNEQQSVTITGSPTGGTFVLSFGGQNTSALAFNADAPTVEAALELLSTIGNGNVRVSGTNPNFTAEFVEDKGKADQALLVLQTNSLTGGSSPSVAIAETVQGRAEADLTLTDGTIVKAGDKYIECGTIMVEITASGKYGPANTAASDGRQTVLSKRGKVWVLEKTHLMSAQQSDHTGDVFDAGQVFKSRMKFGGTGQPTQADVETALPGLSYTG